MSKNISKDQEAAVYDLSTEDQREFMQVLHTQTKLDIPQLKDITEKLIQLATKHAKIAEMKSLHSYDERLDEAKDEMREQIRTLANDLPGVTSVEFLTASRYATVVFELASGRRNRMSGGWSVPVDSEIFESLNENQFWKPYVKNAGVFRLDNGALLEIGTEGDLDDLEVRGANIPDELMEEILESYPSVRAINQDGEVIEIGLDMDYESIVATHIADPLPQNRTGYIVLGIDNDWGTRFEGKLHYIRHCQTTEHMPLTPQKIDFSLHEALFQLMIQLDEANETMKGYQRKPSWNLLA